VDHRDCVIAWHCKFIEVGQTDVDKALYVLRATLSGCTAVGALPIHLFRCLCCKMNGMIYALASMSQTDRHSDSIMPIAHHRLKMYTSHSSDLIVLLALQCKDKVQFQTQHRTVFLNLFFEAEPFATILTACGTSRDDSWIGTIAWSQKSKTSNTLTHEWPDHNYNKVHSLNTKSIFHWTSSGHFNQKQFKFFTGQQQSDEALGCHWHNC